MLLNDQAITKILSKILHYTKPVGMTLKKYANDLYTKSCKVAGIYDKSALKNIFTKRVDSVIEHSLLENWATHPQANVTDIVFKAQLLLGIQKGSVKQPASYGQAAASNPFASHNWLENLANAANACPSLPPTHSFHRRSLRNRSKSPMVLAVNTLKYSFTKPFILSKFSTLSTQINHVIEICLNQTHGPRSCFYFYVKNLTAWKISVPTTFTKTDTAPYNNHASFSDLKSITWNVLTIVYNFRHSRTKN